MIKSKMHDLAKSSYIKIGCMSENFIEAGTLCELSDAMKMKKPKLLGAMSNILFAEDEYDYTFISLAGEFLNIERISDTEVKVGAGVRLFTLLGFLADNGLSGLEELIGIPGSMGGILYMNAGANGKSISDVLVEFDTLSEKSIKKTDCTFSYRHSGIESPIESMVLTFEKSDMESIKSEMSGYLNKRNSTQPFDMPSLGCVFKNPSQKEPAWKLIESVDMRSKCVNDTCVSEKHANFIVNRGRGKAEDFLSLSEEIRRRVKEKHNIELEYEIEILRK